jgi:hypothetical protein
MNKKNTIRKTSARGRRVSLTLLAAGFAAVVSSGSVAEVNVTINFDPQGCPVAPVTDASAGRRQQVTWQAHQNGEPTSTPFKIYFDPLRGQPHNGNTGTVRANIDPSAPKGLYKYTVVGSNCLDKPLDPNIRVY